MRIAMIGQKGLPATFGGVERHVHDLATRLVKAGHTVVAYGRPWYSKNQTYSVEGVHIKNISSLKTKHLDTATHTLLASLHASRQRFDIIHYHGVGPALMAWIPRLLSPQTKVVITFHSIDRHHQKWGLFAKFFLRLGEWSACKFAHETIAVSKSLQNYCFNEFGRDAHYIPNGTALQRLNTTSAESLTQFGVEPEQYLLTVSRLIPHKGTHLLIEAFLKLKAEKAIDSNLKLVIVGDSVHTADYVTRLKNQAASEPAIIFTGFQSGQPLQALFAHSLALVHPSLSEGLPITVLEAMSYARPVLLSDIIEHLEVVKDPRAFFAQNSVRALTDCLTEFLARPTAEKIAMGEGNRRLVRNQYSWNTIIPQTIAVYQKPITQPATATPKLVVST